MDPGNKRVRGLLRNSYKIILNLQTPLLNDTKPTSFLTQMVLKSQNSLAQMMMMLQNSHYNKILKNNQQQ